MLTQGSSRAMAKDELVVRDAPTGGDIKNMC